MKIKVKSFIECLIIDSNLSGYSEKEFEEKFANQEFKAFRNIADEEHGNIYRLGSADNTAYPLRAQFCDIIPAKKKTKNPHQQS